jgi:hypothetical protein
LLGHGFFVEGALRRIIALCLVLLVELLLQCKMHRLNEDIEPALDVSVRFNS